MNTATLLQAQAAPADYSGSIERSWMNFMFGLGDTERFVLILVFVGCATLATIVLASIFAGVTTSIHRRTAEAQLKQGMIERGMSADEIAKIIEATPPTDFLERWACSRSKRPPA